MELVPGKTKLLAFVPKSQSNLFGIQKMYNHLVLNGRKIEFSTTAEHVGILRSIDGNMPNILDRLSSHKKSLQAILPTGMARSHRGSPVASLQLERIFA